MKKTESVASDQESAICTPRPQHADDELVARVLSGDQEAFSVICHKYQRRLIQVAFRITKNAHDAEDAVQEAFLRAYPRINTFKSASSISTWLTKIVINCSLMELRRKRCRQTLSLDERTREGIALIDVLPDEVIDIDNAMACDEYSHLLSEGVARLKPQIRMIFETQLRAELPLMEIAAHFELTVAATKSRLFRARKALTIQLRAKTERRRTIGFR
jgi:RNA polymerase sigma-70 factor (ECF subfamily)